MTEFVSSGSDIIQVYIQVSSVMSSETLSTRNGTEGIELVDLLVNKKPMSRCEVIVNFSLDFNRKTSAAIEEKIEEIWEEKRKNNPRLFNGSKFRFAGVTTNSEAVVFNIGISSYKELMATNCHQYGRELIDYSVKNFCSSNSYMADALGIGSLLSTSDDKFLFIKRAMWTGEDVGKIDRAGGHPEPEKVAPDSQKQYTSLNSDAVRDEIFNSVLDEIVSEINLPLETLSDPLLLGTVRSMERLGRPTAEFLVK